MLESESEERFLVDWRWMVNSRRKVEMAMVDNFSLRFLLSVARWWILLLLVCSSIVCKWWTVKVNII